LSPSPGCDTTNPFTFIDSTSRRPTLPRRGHNKQTRYDIEPAATERPRVRRQLEELPEPARRLAAGCDLLPAPQ